MIKTTITISKITSTFKTQILILFLIFSFISSAQVGIGTTTPSLLLDVEANALADGIQINNIRGNGDPVLQYQVNGTSRITMGIDDSDSDKFKIGSTALTTNTSITIQTNRYIGFRTTTPGNMFHMTNGGTTVGATSMSLFQNLSASGVSLQGYNTSTTSGYSAIEGITNYLGTGFLATGVFGLAINQSAGVNGIAIGVRGHSNEWQGTGVRGSRFNSGGTNSGWGGQFYDDLGYTGFFGLISDLRTKKDIEEIDNAINIINQLNPVTYFFDLEKYPNMGLNEELEYGFIAQEVRDVLPEITRVKGFDTAATIELKPNQQIENKTELFVAMDYTRIIPILTKGMQEQQEIIETQNNRITTLEDKIMLLEERLNTLLKTN